MLSWSSSQACNLSSEPRLPGCKNCRPIVMAQVCLCHENVDILESRLERSHSMLLYRRTRASWLTKHMSFRQMHDVHLLHSNLCVWPSAASASGPCWQQRHVWTIPEDCRALLGHISNMPQPEAHPRHSRKILHNLLIVLQFYNPILQCKLGHVWPSGGDTLSLAFFRNIFNEASGTLPSWSEDQPKALPMLESYSCARRPCNRLFPMWDASASASPSAVQNEQSTRLDLYCLGLVVMCSWNTLWHFLNRIHALFMQKLCCTNCLMLFNGYASLNKTRLCTCLNAIERV